MNIVKRIRENIKEKIHNTVSLLRNNYYHVTREEVHKSIQNIVSTKQKISILKNMYYNKK